MKSIVIFMFLIICSFSKAEQSSSFILGGENATISEFPYMAGIMFDGPWGKNFECGGAIINSKSILTVRKIN